MNMKSKTTQGEKGQALILVAFGIITLFAFVGLGVDLGLAYVERVRAQRAADAAALAAASELPLETAAQLRALEYLSDNGYDCGLSFPINLTAPCTDPNVRLEIKNSAGDYQLISGPADPKDADLTIRLNTAEFRSDPTSLDSASRIQVQVIKQTKFHFMQFLGIKSMDVSGIATAENIQDLDIMLALDESGSMEFDTLCYGCWTRNPSTEYPDGYRWPLPWEGPPNGPPAHCSGTGSPLVYSGKTYIEIEAEEYSAISNDYHRATSPGKGYTYWVMERNGYVYGPQTYYLGDSYAYGRDSRGAYIMHAPYVNIGNGGGGVACTWEDLNNGRICHRSTTISNMGGPFPAPRVDYDFTVPSSGDWYFWIRAQGGDYRDDPQYGRVVFWGLTSDDGTYNNSVLGSSRGNLSQGYKYYNGWHYNGAISSHWIWGRLGTGKYGESPYNFYLKAGTHYTLHFWGGSPGFTIDRIIITNNSSSYLPSAATGSSVPLDNHRTRAACDPCDARFGGYPGGLGNTSADGNDPPNCDSSSLPESKRYRYLDDLYDDEQPIASTVAAAKRFVRKLDPHFDQVGLVTYSSRVNTVVQLQCLKSLGAACSQSTVEGTVIYKLTNRDITHAGGSTNIPDALEEATRALRHTYPFYGRPGAAHIIILMTDGQPNTYSYLDPENSNCYDTSYYPGYSRAQNCSIYLAKQARDQGIVIYTISLGEDADIELMDHIAEITGGVHLHAETPEALDSIFDEIYNRIFLRLVQ